MALHVSYPNSQNYERNSNDPNLSHDNPPGPNLNADFRAHGLLDIYQDIEDALEYTSRLPLGDDDRSENETLDPFRPNVLPQDPLWQSSILMPTVCPEVCHGGESTDRGPGGQPWELSNAHESLTSLIPTSDIGLFNCSTGILQRHADTLENPYLVFPIPVVTASPLPTDDFGAQGQHPWFIFDEEYKLEFRDEPQNVPSGLVAHGCFTGFTLKNNVTREKPDELCGNCGMPVVIWDVYGDSFCLASHSDYKNCGIVSLKNIRPINEGGTAQLQYWLRKIAEQGGNVPNASKRVESLVCRECCNNPAATMYTLKRHFDIHGPRKWKCYGCDSAFHREDSVKRHFYKKHPHKHYVRHRCLVASDTVGC